MADYIAILKKAIEGVDNPTPEVRQQVYEKARRTITRKIEAIDPPPPQAAVDRQMSILETAISDVEAEYMLADATGVMPARTAPSPSAAKPAPTPPPASSLPKAGDNGFSSVAPERRPSDNDIAPAPASVTPARTERLAGVEQKSSRGRIAAILVVLVALAAIAWGAYTYRDQITASLGGSGSTQTDQPAADTADAGDSTAADSQDSTAGDTAAQDTAADTGTDTQPADTAADAGATPPATDGADEPKFTQRLLPDGSEVDEGPAGGEPGIGEGTSVASATQPPEGQAAETDTAQAPQDAAPAEDALPVGQKAIFYEERTTSEEGSALPGSVVWSVVQESPGNDLPPEPAIRAEIAIPDIDLSLRMTIRRNADTTLPASHIIELLFSTPPDFAGGAIDQVQRVTFKSTEQAPGNPLVAFPAPIAEGYFLVALNDAASALQTNMTLLRREPWIDIPVTYKTGRRALITMEKGIPGDKVFDDVLKAWDAVTAGGGDNNG